MSQAQQGHRWFAALYDRMSGGSERRLIGPIRRRLLGDIRGRILEVGAGTGASFQYYSPEARVVAIEPDPFMLQRAQRRAEELGTSNIELRQASAEKLPFEDASFDNVVSTLVLCTVGDQAASLAEARRVLRPGGALCFIEHVRNDSSRFWGTTQDVIRPVWGLVGAGCHPNRRTLQAIRDAGFTIEWSETFSLAPGWPGIYGVARR